MPIAIPPIKVDQRMSFATKGFTGFLEKEKAREFVVVNSFRETFQETFLIPHTSGKYRRKIIEIEIRKRCAFDSFSYLYLLPGEKFVENKKVEWDRFRVHVSQYEIDRYLPML